MNTLDGLAAAAVAENSITNTPGYCFSRVSDYFGRPDSTGPGAGHYGGPAIALWTYSQDRHPGDRNPPRGVALLFGALSAPRWAGDENYAMGDVTMSLGDGLMRATDYPVNGVVGTCDIDQREVQTGRPYLGWIGDYLGNPVRYGITTTAAVSSTPISTTIQGDDDMGFYIQASGAGSKYWFSQTNGRVREIPKAEWDFLRAASTTSGGVPLQLVTVSQNWLNRALALG